jgi:hypothetical protein
MPRSPGNHSGRRLPGHRHVFPFAFFASVGRGFLLPIGVVLLDFVPGTVVAAVG